MEMQIDDSIFYLRPPGNSSGSCKPGSNESREEQVLLERRTTRNSSTTRSGKLLKTRLCRHLSETDLSDTSICLLQLGRVRLLIK
jgi:hypothetical protein